MRNTTVVGFLNTVVHSSAVVKAVGAIVVRLWIQAESFHLLSSGTTPHFGDWNVNILER